MQRKTTQTRLCIACGAAFRARLHEIERGRGKYCSRACYRPGTPTERFWRRVNKDSTAPAHRPELGPCWLWTGYTDPKGYGYVSKKAAHRTAWELTYGAIPHDAWVLHRCDTPSCVRPEHLFLGTLQENVQDCVDKGRHPHGATHGGAKLTETAVQDIRRLYAAGRITHKALGERYGVNQTSVTRIVNRQYWRDSDS